MHNLIKVAASALLIIGGIGLAAPVAASAAGLQPVGAEDLYLMEQGGTIVVPAPDAPAEDVTTLAYTGIDDVATVLVAPMLALLALGVITVLYSRRRAHR